MQDARPEDPRQGRFDTLINPWDRPASTPDPAPAFTETVGANFNAHYQGVLHEILVSPSDTANAAARGIKLPIGHDCWLFDPETNQRVRAKVKGRMPDGKGVIMTVYWGTIESCREAPELRPENVREKRDGKP